MEAEGDDLLKKEKDCSETLNFCKVIIEIADTREQACRASLRPAGERGCKIAA
jgi:hypothetical protein